jgi:DNA-binding response OmpR family regulator
VLEAFIAHLRRKLCANGEPDLIVTLRGAGYSLRESLTP